MNNSATTPQRQRSASYWQGESIGQADAQVLLAEAKQQKGNTQLTARDIRSRYLDATECRNKEWQEGLVEDDWFEGWHRAVVLACLDAEKNAPDPEGLWKPGAASLRRAKREAQHAVAVTFRRATIFVQNPEQFFEGVRFGQRAVIEDTERPTVAHLFEELAVDLVQHSPKSVSLDWRLGYLLGRTDALLRDRQYYPAGAKAGAHHG
jgi:hypothetical protein